MSKIQFWKQFTTIEQIDVAADTLYSICQRYNFESNLQLDSIFTTATNNCIRYVKDTILKAIYNGQFKTKVLLQTVFDMSKIQFWKQFTTRFRDKRSEAKLYSICQRYNFESNLQHLTALILLALYCIRYVKDTILKAIYNKTSFTLKCGRLYSICQRYNFESNLQRAIQDESTATNCIRYVKDTILKAIYNSFSRQKKWGKTVFDMSKIQFWKQFTTFNRIDTSCIILYSICQRYNFESNLQQNVFYP